MPKSPQGEPRAWIARGYTWVEDIVYIGLGLLLAALVLSLLVTAFGDIGRSLVDWSVAARTIALLDQILLILLVVELLYTVQVSFRAHALAPEPFLLVGLISAIRRVLLLTAEMGKQHEPTETSAHAFVWELAVLAGLILALAVALMLVRRGRVEVERLKE
jgi:uncharacterized membrane protein (DUF373 family)